jgi:competence protein ComEA
MTSPTRANEPAFAAPTAHSVAAHEASTRTVAAQTGVTHPAPPAFHLFSFLLGLITALTLVGGTLFLVRRPEPAPVVLQPPPTPAPTATAPPTPEPGPITVFVSGAVATPGLYVLAADARVGDAIIAAGGLADDAAGALVNQAERIWDGAQIHVPAAPPAGDGPAAAAPVVAAAAPVAGVSGASRSVDLGSLATGGGINLNSASASELETLPGIGPSKAAAIIANRPYDSVDDLERVPGIGPKTIDQFRDLVTAP